MPFDNLPYAEKIAQHGFVPANHHEPQFFEVGCEKADERAAQIDAIRAAYDEMSATYQASKSDNDIPLN
jgi:hypothetical protein